MFEISVKKRFESDGICPKILPKSDQNGGLGRVRNRMGTAIEQRAQKVVRTPPFWKSFWGQFGLYNLIVFLLFFERVLFATLGAIGEGMGRKVVPKGSKKVSKRDNLEASVDF